MRRRAISGIVACGLLAATGALAAGEAGRRLFASPEAAFAALVEAGRSGERAELLAILGADANRILDSGDAVADRESMERFVASYDAAHTIERPGEAHAELAIGEDEWPFPIPVVKEQGGWRFDTDAGDEEILARRIGRNELFTLQACLAFVDAQREYWGRNPDRAPLLHYARRLLSSEGKRDGLYYPTDGGEEPSPLGEGFARAKAAGYDDLRAGKPQPFHGYHYRILTGQGPHARGGAYGYLAGDWMIGGFALLAYPATWDNSGVMSFLVNQDGAVYQKDLGPETAKLAAAIDRFDPDESWMRVADEDL